MSVPFKNYEQWLATVPASLSTDSLWRVEAYRLALFAADLAWVDTESLRRDRRVWGLVRQLLESAGSVPANISEGYSRGHEKDRARFYEFALGSAREARTWYFVQRWLLSAPVVEHRMNLLTSIARLLLKMIPDQRGISLHEDRAEYGNKVPAIEELLTNVPVIPAAFTDHESRITPPHAAA
ncbi:MAG TPA: four helix bundle protein, partial [Verrucomicrobiae bacterium]|nr:four helix bundle protein [Verrucomicrobiae bacterium]